MSFAPAYVSRLFGSNVSWWSLIFISLVKLRFAGSAYDGPDARDRVKNRSSFCLRRW